ATPNAWAALRVDAALSGELMDRCSRRRWRAFGDLGHKPAREPVIAPAAAPSRGPSSPSVHDRNPTDESGPASRRPAAIVAAYTASRSGAATSDAPASRSVLSRRADRSSRWTRPARRTTTSRKIVIEAA